MFRGVSGWVLLDGLSDVVGGYIWFPEVCDLIWVGIIYILKRISDLIGDAV